MHNLLAITQAKIGDGWTVEGLLLGVVILVVAIAVLKSLFRRRT